MDSTYTLTLLGSNNDMRHVEAKFTGQKGFYDPFNSSTIKLDNDKTARLINTAGTNDFTAMRDIYIKQATHIIICIDPSNHETLTQTNDFLNQIFRVNEAISNSNIFIACSQDYSTQFEIDTMNFFANKLQVNLLNYDSISPKTISELIIDENSQFDIKLVLEKYAQRKDDKKTGIFKKGMQKIRSFATGRSENQEIKISSDLQNALNANHEKILTSLLYGPVSSNQELKYFAAQHFDIKNKDLTRTLLQSRANLSIYNRYNDKFICEVIKDLKKFGLVEDIQKLIADFYKDLL